METWEEIDQAIKATRLMLSKEKEIDFEQFQKTLNTLNQKKKVEKGFSWHPCQVLKKGFSIGNRVFIVLKKPESHDGPHRLRAGAPVEVFPSNKADEGKKRPSKTGVVNYADRRKMKIILNTEEFPFWIDDGDLSVELQFDERTYVEMEKAMALLQKVDKGRLKELKGVFFGKIPPSYSKIRPIDSKIIRHLNDSQEKAVQHILSANEFAIIHGPPGTGKTTTLVQAIKALSEYESNILVCAPSNAAVDLLAERCSQEGLNVVRIGNISRVDESILSLTLDARLAEHSEAKNIKKVRMQADQLRRKTKKFKNWGKGNARRQQLDDMREAKELEAWARQLENQLLDEVLFQANVICCTLVNSTHKSLQKLTFKTVILDEAAQALEPASWIPMLRAERVVLAGDPFQLPPTVKSQEAKKLGFETTLLEKAIKNFEQQAFLDTQYRMNESIMQFSNGKFYNSQLKAADFVKDWKLKNWAGKALEYIDTAGCGFEEKVNEKSLSRCNEGEWFIFREHFLQLVTTQDIANFPSVGFISPYKEQVMYVQEMLADDEQLQPYAEFINIKTIDGFQGQEKDIIYISLVRSNRKAEIGFLKDYRRMNVAMTRARKLLVVIGDSATVGADGFYGEFLDYVEQAGSYRTGWEFMSGE